MSELLSAVILGIVEGITEFLPISSTGHLIVASELLNFRDTGGTFEIGIQLGAVLAVLWFYRSSLTAQARSVKADVKTRRFWLAIVIAFIPAGIVGFLLSDYITSVLFSPQVVAASLIGGGIILWIVEKLPREADTTEVEDVSLRQAIIVGIAQITALIPGVSRSGSTIVGGLLAGLDRPAATGFSFYLAIPTLGAATCYALLKGASALDGDALAAVAVGLVVSFVTALLAISWLLRYISRNDFKLFAVYRIIAGIVVLLIFGLR